MFACDLCRLRRLTFQSVESYSMQNMRDEGKLNGCVVNNWDEDNNDGRSEVVMMRHILIMVARPT